MLYFLLMMIMCALLIAVFIWKKVYIKTSSLAAVMALGIITQGVLSNYFSTGEIKELDKLLSILTFSLWISFLFSLFLALIHNQFKTSHLANPINRFGIGTWVAGTSICSILLYNHFPMWQLAAKYIAILNIFLWMAFITLSLFSFRNMYRLKLWRNVHGILLLTTVSTQSLILELHTVFEGKIAGYVNISFLVIGIAFYLVCAAFILCRYIGNFRQLDITSDWNNTNCILHGALSITGLAGIYANVYSTAVLLALWGITASVFLMVESIEVYRLIRRMQRLGFAKGILVYDVSQWSRLFTFGMFYTFTFQSHTGAGLSSLPSAVIHIGIWVILFLLLIEVLLSMKFMLGNLRLPPKQIKGAAS
ncbi:hypothetical protein [Terribacillus sp. FSL K6-0262]|uniref:hypothetical protein n=1 Tax=Terribacillus sp. FSL K6-0262 TaxID=2921447 RepID=UPI0030EE47FC